MAVLTRVPRARLDRERTWTARSCLLTPVAALSRSWDEIALSKQPPTCSQRPSGEPSPPTNKVLPAQERRHLLPKDLPNAVNYLSDEELDRLLTVALAEARRRGRSLPAAQPSRTRQQGEGTASLPRGQLNAVRAAFKAGVTPARIARQFGLSQSDVRKALASEASGRGTID